MKAGVCVKKILVFGEISACFVAAKSFFFVELAAFGQSEREKLFESENMKSVQIWPEFLCIFAWKYIVVS